MTADLHLILARSLGLLALVLFGYTALLRLRVGPLPRQLLAGLLFGGGAVVSMLDPAPIAPGVIADARSVMLGLAAPFGGPWSAPIAAAVVAAYRLWLGGAGAPAGALGAAISAAAGLLFWALMPKSRAALSLPSLVLLGGMASFNIFSAFLLPWETALKVVGTAGLPLTATTTGGILLFGTLLGRERERVARDALFRATFDSAPDALFVTEVGRDGGLAVGSLNPAALALLGHENQAKPGTPLAAVLPAELRDAALEDLRRCVAEGRTLQLQRSQVLHGRKAHWDLTLVPIRDELGRIGHVFSRRADITWRVEAEESLRRAAYADPLTGLANRRAFLAALESRLAAGEGPNLALALFDLDG
ncbi:MAG TPA: LytS/YhcK type 5TM receptor domain-containing protein, partial [Alphaproteobacteria bacterium]|nr:LytS/YhcK type 5TM receptor domain-containing protein [Alphaproteobacteria bacterium]